MGDFEYFTAVADFERAHEACRPFCHKCGWRQRLVTHPGNKPGSAANLRWKVELIFPQIGKAWKKKPERCHFISRLNFIFITVLFFFPEALCVRVHSSIRHAAFVHKQFITVVFKNKTPEMQ